MFYNITRARRHGFVCLPLYYRRIICNIFYEICIHKAIVHFYSYRFVLQTRIITRGPRAAEFIKNMKKYVRMARCITLSCANRRPKREKFFSNDITM